MRSEESSPTRTVLTISAGLQVLYYVLEWEWALFISIAVCIVGVFSFPFNKKIDWLWKKLAEALNSIFSPIILGLVFYLILYPTATLAKRFGAKDPLLLQNRLPSTFKNKMKQYGKESFHKTW